MHHIGWFSYPNNKTRGDEDESNASKYTAELLLNNLLDLYLALRLVV